MFNGKIQREKIEEYIRHECFNTFIDNNTISTTIAKVISRLTAVFSVATTTTSKNTSVASSATLGWPEDMYVDFSES